MWHQRSAKEEGFSIVELMVVVGVIALLLTIAIPTFLGLQRRAEDRAAQSSLRDAFIAARAFHADKHSYAGFDALDGEEIEHTLVWADGAANAHRQINIEAATAVEVTLTTLSSSGQIYCLADSSTAPTGRVAGLGDASTYAACAALDDW